jgi:hypothetical protein
MSLQIEQDTCTGRGFADTDASGFCAKFKTWIQKAPASGGPGWTILVDRSTAPVAKTISSVNTTTEELTITAHGFFDGEPIRFQNSGGALPGGLSAGTIYYAFVVSVNVIKVCATWFSWLGQSYINITSAGSGTNQAIMTGPYIVVSNLASPAVQSEAKILKVGYNSSYAGYVSVQMFMSKGFTVSTHPVGVWAGYYLKTVDAGAFTYNFRGGLDFLLLQTRPPAGAVWWRVGIDEFTVLSNFTEDPDTVGGVVATTVSYTPGASETTVTLSSSAEVNTLTTGNGYFIYYAGVQSTVGKYYIVYGIVSKRGVADGLAADQIAFSFLSKPLVTGDQIYAGARVTPYPLRAYTIANTLDEIDTNIRDFNYRASGSRYRSSVPAISFSETSQSYFACHSMQTSIQVSVMESVEAAAIDKGAMDDGKFVVMRPLLIENTTDSGSTAATLGANKLLGEGKNTFISKDTGMIDMETGRIISGNAFICVGADSTLFASTPSGSRVVLVPQTESV